MSLIRPLAVLMMLACSYGYGHHCAFYPTSFGVATDGKGRHWIEAEFSVDPNATSLEHATKISLKGQSRMRVGQTVKITTSLAKKIGDSAYRHLLFYTQRPADAAKNDDKLYSILSFNYFLETVDIDGKKHQIWLTDPDQGFTLENSFWGYPFTYVARRPGGITYIKKGSPIMRYQSDCQH